MDVQLLKTNFICIWSMAICCNVHIVFRISWPLCNVCFEHLFLLSLEMNFRKTNSPYFEIEILIVGIISMYHHLKPMYSWGVALISTNLPHGRNLKTMIGRPTHIQFLETNIYPKFIFWYVSELLSWQYS